MDNKDYYTPRGGATAYRLAQLVSPAPTATKSPGSAEKAAIRILGHSNPTYYNNNQNNNSAIRYLQHSKSLTDAIHLFASPHDPQNNDNNKRPQARPDYQNHHQYHHQEHQQHEHQLELEQEETQHESHQRPTKRRAMFDATLMGGSPLPVRVTSATSNEPPVAPHHHIERDSLTPLSSSSDDDGEYSDSQGDDKGDAPQVRTTVQPVTTTSPPVKRVGRGRPKGSKDGSHVDKTKRGRPKGAKNTKGTKKEREAAQRDKNASGVVAHQHRGRRPSEDDEPASLVTLATVAEATKKTRGRPLGSKNKLKPELPAPIVPARISAPPLVPLALHPYSQPDLSPSLSPSPSPFLSPTIHPLPSSNNTATATSSSFSRTTVSPPVSSSSGVLAPVIPPVSSIRLALSDDRSTIV
ncbi:hypothetical protein T439DRAFT_327606 [Meredithblackwellia eburnea MCA 4105]